MAIISNDKMTNYINGNELAEEVIQDIIKRKDPDYKYRLGIVLVGDNPASLSFIRKKEEVCEKVGVKMLLFQYPKEITTRKLRMELGHLQKTRNVDGLIVQIPLPKHISVDRILDGIQPEKDVDCLSSKCIGKTVKGLKGVSSPLVQALDKIINFNKIDTKGKRILVVGGGRLIGKPITSYFINRKDTVMISDVHEQNLAELCGFADIIVLGVGKGGLITKDMIKEGAIIIDCGFSLNSDGQIKGDVPASEFEGKASLVCPVPNGIGPIMTAFLVSNVIHVVGEAVRFGR